MIEEAIFIERRISHYGAMLRLTLDAEDRANITRLLVEAEQQLEVAKARRDVEVGSASLTLTWYFGRLLAEGLLAHLTANGFVIVKRESG